MKLPHFFYRASLYRPTVRFCVYRNPWSSTTLWESYVVYPYGTDALNVW